MTENRKVRYTRKVIKEGFLQLLKERPIGKITIAEICEIADVHRGTFYQHYQDIYQLLGSIEDELYTKLKDMLPSFESDPLTTITSTVVELIYGEQDACHALLGPYGDSQFLQNLLDLCYESCIEKYRKAGVSEEDFSFIYTYATSGSIGLIKAWATSGYTAAPEKIMTYIDNISKRGLSAYIKA